MIGHRDEHLDRCAALALGVLDEAGRAELEAHMATGCATCESALRALSGGATVLALSVPQRRAPDVVRERVLGIVRAEAIARTREGVVGATAPALERPAVVESPRRERPRVALWALAAAAVLMAVTGALAWRRAEQLTARLATLEARSLELQQTLQSERRWAALLDAPVTRVVRLERTPDGDSTLSARVLYDPGSQRAILVASGFALTAERDYELWAITATGPTSLGVVRADRSGRAVARLEHVHGEALGDGPIAAFAISLEASGGSTDHRKPSGPVVMLSKLGS